MENIYNNDLANILFVSKECLKINTKRLIKSDINPLSLMF